MRLKSAEFPPGRACRAWWRQSCVRHGITVEFRWPSGEWSAEAAAPRAPHNRLLLPPYEDASGMLVIAEENQRCALWGYRPALKEQNPEVYQSDLGDESYGPWYATGLSEQTFTTQFGLWNQANGGSEVSLVGERSDKTGRCLDALPVIVDRPDYRVYASGSAQIAASPDADIYIWGPHEHVVRAIAADLSLAWDDLEA
jgi:hypothetical protein